MVDFGPHILIVTSQVTHMLEVALNDESTFWNLSGLV
jgi:hypothetical protein